jgi:hypothetical protein
MNSRDKLDEFAELNGINKNTLIGWSLAADFAEWYAEQKALRQQPVSCSACDLLRRLKEANMCSVIGDELIYDFFAGAS